MKNDQTNGPTIAKARLDLEAERCFFEASERFREALLCMGRALLRMREAGHWKARQCASLAEWCESMGVPASVGWMAFDLASLLAHEPGLEAAVRAGPDAPGGLHVGLAAALLPFVREPSLLREGETLRSLAAENPTTKQVKQLVKARRAASGDQERRHARTFHLTDQGALDLDRSRAVASQKAQRVLDENETLETIARDYLARHDKRERKPGPRRMPDTDGSTHRRYPAQVDLWFERAYGGTCAIWRCDNSLLKDRAHRVPKAEGGSQEADNGCPLCKAHHRMFDHGDLALVEVGDGVFFRNAQGRFVGELLRPPADLLPRERREATGPSP